MAQTRVCVAVDSTEPICMALWRIRLYSRNCWAGPYRRGLPDTRTMPRLRNGSTKTSGDSRTCTYEKGSQIVGPDWPFVPPDLAQRRLIVAPPARTAFAIARVERRDCLHVRCPSIMNA